MNREEAAKLLPIIKAFSEGKEIQKFIKNYTVGSDRWIDVNSIDTSDKREYRIKPEPTYRPFKDAEECWQEMLKHQPFGWIKFQGAWLLIVNIDDKSIGYGSACGATIHSKFDNILKCTTFADGTPFGVKVEE